MREHRIEEAQMGEKVYYKKRTRQQMERANQSKASGWEDSSTWERC